MEDFRGLPRPGQTAALADVCSQVGELATDQRLDPALRPRAYLLALTMAELTGEWPLLVQAAEAVFAAGECWGTWPDVGVCRLESARVLSKAGLTEQAAEILKLFLEHLGRYPHLEMYRGDSEYRLGILLQRCRQHHSALQFCRRAVSSLADDPAKQLLAYLQCAWLALRLSCHREAGSYLEESESLASNSTLSLLHQSLQALLWQRTDRTEAARRLAEAVYTAADGNGPSRALAAFVLAENAARQRRSAQAAAWRRKLRAETGSESNDELLRLWFGKHRR